MTRFPRNFVFVNKRSDSVPQNSPIVQFDATLTQSYVKIDYAVY